MIGELGLRNDTMYLTVRGDQVFTQILELPFRNLRRAELEKAVGAELESVVPVDLEDMVFAFEPINADLPGAVVPGFALEPGAEQPRGRVASAVSGMRVLSFVMRQDKAEAILSYLAQTGAVAAE